MFRRYLPAAVLLLAAAAFALTPDTAAAQHRGGGGGHGGHAGASSHGGGNWNGGGGNWNGGRYGNRGWGGVGIGIGLGYPYYGGGGYGWAGRPWYGGSGYYDTYPNYYYGGMPNADTSGASYDYGSTAQPAQDNEARIRVVVPQDAKVWFDDQQTNQKGAVRFFETPPLKPGREYTYDVKAQWRDENGKDVTRTRQVDVRPNSAVTVDFNR